MGARPTQPHNMIPSRGLRWSSQTIGIGRRRILPVTTRQFSSTPAQHRAHGLLSKNRASLPGTSYTALRLSQTNTLIRNAASIRFASTTPLPASTVAEEGVEGGEEGEADEEVECECWTRAVLSSGRLWRK